uniref:stathmin domain-containing protein 1 n=1 Tax=Centroberyx gerrardi TaxID=166262 RepID=UPI003AAC9A23
MGCGRSKTTVVHPMRSGELEGNEDETGSKHGGRGDSAVSKGTTDSGVVMENREIPVLPGAVPRKLPPLTAGPGLQQQDGPAVERPDSSDILEELLNQGIIPVGQSRERGSGAGEAYNIMLDDSEEPRRRPPARLESLKSRKEQSPTSREAIDQKMRLAEERRKSREDELKTRLRTKSARVRGPAPSSTALEEVNAAAPVEQLQKPLTPDPPGTPGSHEDTPDPPLHTQLFQ